MVQGIYFSRDEAFDGTIGKWWQKTYLHRFKHFDKIWVFFSVGQITNHKRVGHKIIINFSWQNQSKSTSINLLFTFLIFTYNLFKKESSKLLLQSKNYKILLIYIQYNMNFINWEDKSNDFKRLFVEILNWLISIDYCLLELSINWQIILKPFDNILINKNILIFAMVRLVIWYLSSAVILFNHLFQWGFVSFYLFLCLGKTTFFDPLINVIRLNLFVYQFPYLSILKVRILLHFPQKLFCWFFRKKCFETFKKITRNFMRGRNTFPNVLW